jgi:hypothetical protein
VTVGEGWLSPGYGVVHAAPVVTYQERGDVPRAITFVLAPFAAGATVDIDGLLRWVQDLR